MCLHCGAAVVRVNSFKFLDIHISDDLYWAQHVTEFSIDLLHVYSGELTVGWNMTRFGNARMKEAVETGGHYRF